MYLQFHSTVTDPSHGIHTNNSRMADEITSTQTLPSNKKKEL